VTLGLKSSSWRRIFIGSHSLPSLWFVVSVLQLAGQAGVTQLFDLLQWRQSVHHVVVGEAVQ
jgi:hypothetical protein